MREVRYAHRDSGDLKLLIYERDDPSDLSPRPAILMYHGGGWIKGQPQALEPFCEHFADEGLIAISVQYRLIGNDRSLSPFDCLEDAKAAYRYVLEHANELNIDPERIAVGGGSAGGHLATALVPFGDEDLAKPAALVLYNPAIDLSENGWKGGRNKVQQAGEDPMAFSPAHHVEPGFPPTLIVHGTDDDVTPVGGMRDFRARVLAAGGRCQLIEFPGRGHAFFNHQDPHGDREFVMVNTISFLQSLWPDGF